MTPRVIIARNVLSDLSHLVAEATPALSTVRGDLFLPDNLPFAAIRLNIPFTDYIAYLAALPPGERPQAFRIVPVKDLPFHIVINGAVRVENGGTAIGGKPATIL
jgi:hypothetical protein